MIRPEMIVTTTSDKAKEKRIKEIADLPYREWSEEDRRKLEEYNPLLAYILQGASE